MTSCIGSINVYKTTDVWYSKYMKKTPESYNPYQACYESGAANPYEYMVLAHSLSAPDARDLLGVDPAGVRRWSCRPTIFEDQEAEFYERPWYIVSANDLEYTEDAVLDVIDEDGETLTEVIGKDGADYFVDKFITMSQLAVDGSYKTKSKLK